MCQTRALGCHWNHEILPAINTKQYTTIIYTLNGCFPLHKLMLTQTWVDARTKSFYHARLIPHHTNIYIGDYSGNKYHHISNAYTFQVNGLVLNSKNIIRFDFTTMTWSDVGMLCQFPQEVRPSSTVDINSLFIY